MPFSLEKVVPWGRSCEEYLEMFDLSREDLERRILGCGDGPASFNCGLTRRGGRGVSRHLEGVVGGPPNLGYAVTIEEVPYEFQRGGNRMLVVSSVPSAASP